MSDLVQKPEKERKTKAIPINVLMSLIHKILKHSNIDMDVYRQLELWVTSV